MWSAWPATRWISVADESSKTPAGTVPFAAAIAARLVDDDDRLTPVRIGGMALGVLGIVALLGLDVRGAQLSPIGAVALVVLGYATAPMIANRGLADVPGVAVSSVALFVTAVVYAPFALPRADQVVAASGSAKWSLVVLGALCNAVALALFFALIREAGPQRALVIIDPEPGGRLRPTREAVGGNKDAEQLPPTPGDLNSRVASWAADVGKYGHGTDEIAEEIFAWQDEGAALARELGSALGADFEVTAF